MPAELYDFAVTHGKNLGVLEAPTRFLRGDIGDEDVVPVGYEVFVLNP